MKRFNITNEKDSEGIQKFESVNEELQESFYKGLGVNILWIDEYHEIPNILKEIKGK